MDDAISDFFVTLPSNASMEYFPRNTQSSYRTKLISPLLLNNGEWEVGLVQFFAPRNWFNVDDHNNDYTIYNDVEKVIVRESVDYEIMMIYDPAKSIADNFYELNQNIKNYIPNHQIQFAPDEDGSNIEINLPEGIEIHLSQETSSKLLYMLHLPNEDYVVNRPTIMKLRPSTETFEQMFKVVNKNPINVTHHLIPLTKIKEKFKGLNTKNVIFSNISENIKDLELENYVLFKYEPIKNILEIKVSEYAELYITDEKAPSFLRMLKQHKDIVVRGSQKFTVNPLLSITQGELVELVIKEYSSELGYEREVKDLRLNVGMYNSAEVLFNQFQHVILRQLPDLKVLLIVPYNFEIKFGRGLADMLGFVEDFFTSGTYISKYPLELNAGISEIFVYTDIIESHRVGDTFAPLLRIIPCMDEKNQQIVKYYETPLYFPLRKSFIDTIEIELKSVTGKNITFTGGKSCIILSFRRKKL